jgi:hypothetical protein
MMHGKSNKKFTRNVTVVYVLLDEQFPDVSKDRNTRMATKNEGMRHPTLPCCK